MSSCLKGKAWAFSFAKIALTMEFHLYTLIVQTTEVGMKKISIEYPESMLATLNLSPDTFETEARIALAMKLYEMGRLTSGQAADLAGISRVEFLLSCHRYDSASVKWDQDELEAEFEESRP